MNSEKILNLLNKLIQIINDRIEGYEIASKETEETDLKNLFSQFICNSKKFRTELVNEVKKLGGDPLNGTNTSGKLFRVWMDATAASAVRDRKSILISCEYGDSVAVGVFSKTIKENFKDLSPYQHIMLNAHHVSLKNEYKKIRDLCDKMAA